MFFDTHAHYEDSKFDSDRSEILTFLKSNGIDYIIDPGSDIASTMKAMDISGKYDFVYFASGMHPEEVKNAPDDYLSQIAEFASDKKCVAIGEIGLDYYWDDSNKAQQKLAFESQLQLSLDMNLPVIIHDREAHGDSLDICRNFSGIKGVFHCFSGSAEMAEQLLSMGFYLGFDGPITYKNNKKANDIISLCPNNRMLLETDSPYMPPVPKRGERNNSSNLLYIAQKIADIKCIAVEDVAQITFNNAKECFKKV